MFFGIRSDPRRFCQRSLSFKREDSKKGAKSDRLLVGHGSPEMTAHYSHSLAAGRKAAGRLPGLGKTAKKE